jgi:hypothetical protein
MAGHGGWRRWRRTRPFWGALLILLGAAEILASIRAPLPVVLHVGPQGLAGYLVPLLMLLCGILLLANPAQRTFYSIVSIVMALASWLTSNLGGFLVGLLLGVVGGSLAFGWAPAGQAAGRRRRPRRSSEDGAGRDAVRSEDNRDRGTTRQFGN